MSANRQLAIPRPSSSLIVVDEKNRVLMVERNPNSTSFAGAYVFPGGNHDPQQDVSNKMTAIRETFEESGLLLASSATSNPLHESTLDAARRSIHAQKLSFASFLAKNELTADVDSLLPFTQWITPPIVPRRFHTHFFLTFLPASFTGFSSGQHLQQRLPTPDGGVEVISARFLKPQDAISEFKAEKISLMPPQYYLLTSLAAILSGDVNTPEQRAIVTRLALGAFGRLAINPRALPEKDDQGLVILTYEGDEARGGRLGARHRVHVRFAKGVMHLVVFERNIDIFSDVAFESCKTKL